MWIEQLKLQTVSKLLKNDRTPAAKDRLKYLLSKQGHPVLGIRIGLKKGGCNGYVYTMNFAEKIEKNDEVIKDEDVTVIIDPKAAFAVVGTEMDYVTSKVKSEFVFTNPHVKSACGCGESFSLADSSKDKL